MDELIDQIDAFEHNLCDDIEAILPGRLRLTFLHLSMFPHGLAGSLVKRNL